jgi:hypothetical protein
MRRPRIKYHCGTAVLKMVLDIFKSMHQRSISEGLINTWFKKQLNGFHNGSSQYFHGIVEAESSSAETSAPNIFILSTPSVDEEPGETKRSGD